MEYVEFSELNGQAIKEIVVDDDVVRFVTDTATYRMLHRQDCCEHVYLESTDGDVGELQGAKVIDAYEATSERTYGGESETWTFYRLVTDKGTRVFRWIGSSNGYYSETVDFVKDD